jgi:hypothetical protein
MKLTGSRYQCIACGQHFAGPNAYGLHYDSLSAACLSAAALRAAGMTTNAAGFWTVTDPPRSALYESTIGAM